MELENDKSVLFRATILIYSLLSRIKDKDPGLRITYPEEVKMLQAWFYVCKSNGCTCNSTAWAGLRICVYDKGTTKYTS